MLSNHLPVSETILGTKYLFSDSSYPEKFGQSEFEVTCPQTSHLSKFSPSTLTANEQFRDSAHNASQRCPQYLS